MFVWSFGLTGISVLLRYYRENTVYLFILYNYKYFFLLFFDICQRNRF